MSLLSMMPILSLFISNNTKKHLCDNSQFCKVHSSTNQFDRDTIHKKETDKQDFNAPTCRTLASFRSTAHMDIMKRIKFMPTSRHFAIQAIHLGLRLFHLSCCRYASHG
jgi:hypothetical protein